MSVTINTKLCQIYDATSKKYTVSGKHNRKPRPLLNKQPWQVSRHQEAVGGLWRQTFSVHRYGIWIYDLLLFLYFFPAGFMTGTVLSNTFNIKNERIPNSPKQFLSEQLSKFTNQTFMRKLQHLSDYNVWMPQSWLISSDMRKGVDTRTLSAEILTDCRNCLLDKLNSSYSS